MPNSKVVSLLLQLYLTVIMIITLLFLRKNFMVRRWWVKRHITSRMRKTYGFYDTVFKYFKTYDEEEFFQLTRMSVKQFVELIISLKNYSFMFYFHKIYLKRKGLL